MNPRALGLRQLQRAIMMALQRPPKKAAVRRALKKGAERIGDPLPVDSRLTAKSRIGSEEMTYTRQPSRVGEKPSYKIAPKTSKPLGGGPVEDLNPGVSPRSELKGSRLIDFVRRTGQYGSAEASTKAVTPAAPSFAERLRERLKLRTELGTGFRTKPLMDRPLKSEVEGRPALPPASGGSKQRIPGTYFDLGGAKEGPPSKTDLVKGQTENMVDSLIKKRDIDEKMTSEWPRGPYVRVKTKGPELKSKEVDKQLRGLKTKRGSPQGVLAKEVSKGLTPLEPSQVNVRKKKSALNKYPTYNFQSNAMAANRPVAGEKARLVEHYNQEIRATGKYGMGSPQEESRHRILKEQQGQALLESGDSANLVLTPPTHRVPSGRGGTEADRAMDAMEARVAKLPKGRFFPKNTDEGALQGAATKQAKEVMNAIVKNSSHPEYEIGQFLERYPRQAELLKNRINYYMEEAEDAFTSMAPREAAKWENHNFYKALHFYRNTQKGNMQNPVPEDVELGLGAALLAAAENVIRPAKRSMGQRIGHAEVAAMGDQAFDRGRWALNRFYRFLGKHEVPMPPSITSQGAPQDKLNVLARVKSRIGPPTLQEREIIDSLPKANTKDLPNPAIRVLYPPTAEGRKELRRRRAVREAAEIQSRQEGVGAKMKVPKVPTYSKKKGSAPSRAVDYEGGQYLKEEALQNHTNVPFEAKDSTGRIISRVFQKKARSEIRLQTEIGEVFIDRNGNIDIEDPKMMKRVKAILKGMGYTVSKNKVTRYPTAKQEKARAKRARVSGADGNDLFRRTRIAGSAEGGNSLGANTAKLLQAIRRTGPDGD